MAWHTTNDLDEFDDAAGALLRADPIHNTVLLTVAATLRRRGLDLFGDAPPSFGWFQAEGADVEAAFLQTLPHPALVSGLPTRVVEPLVAALVGAAGISGPVASVEAFADARQAATGRSATVAMRQRLYHLAELTPPRPMPEGAARVATPADRDLLATWFGEFARDVGQPSTADARGAVADRISYGGLMLWEVDGVPVAMAGATRPAAGMVRVAPVFTPAPSRGKGYAGAVTAAVSRQALDAGHDVVLFTDLANPTSNALYQRIGYREVDDYLVLSF